MKAALLVVAVALLAMFAFEAHASLTWTVLGDWGSVIHYSKTIAARSVKAKSEFVMAIGDNFYLAGVKSLKDRKWKTIFENVYTQKFFQKRWYVIAGNHDYRGNLQAQLDYTKHSKRWYFPSLYYKIHKKIDAHNDVDFVFLDTTPMYDHHKGQAMLKWFEDTLKASTAKWIIVIGHHQIYSLGGTSAYMEQNLVHLLEKYKVAAYINGHHHTLQHMKSSKVDYIVVGNTGAVKPAARDKAPGPVATKFHFPTKAQFKKLGRRGGMGFSIMRLLDGKNMKFYFYSSLGHALYSATVTNSR